MSNSFGLIAGGALVGGGLAHLVGIGNPGFTIALAGICLIIHYWRNP